MSEDTTYKISIQGAGLSLDREVPKEIGEQMVVLLLTGTAVAPQAIQSVTSAPIVQQAPAAIQPPLVTPSMNSKQHPDTSIREFLDEYEAKRAPDKITAIGKYLKRHCNQPDFDRNDLVSFFENAAEPVPKNITRDIKWTLKAGWIALKNGSKDRYYVTNSGKTAVEQKFSKDVVKRTKGLTPSGGKKSTTNQGSEG